MSNEKEFPSIENQESDNIEPDFSEDVNASENVLENNENTSEDIESKAALESASDENISSEQNSEQDKEENASIESSTQSDDDIPEEIKSSKEKLSEFAHNVKNKIINIKYPNCIMRLAGVYLFVVSYFMVYHRSFVEDHSYKAIYNWQDYRNAISLPVVLIITIAGFIIATLLKSAFLKNTRTDSYFCIGGLVAFSLISLWRCDNFYYAVVFILITALLGYFAYKYDRNHSKVRLHGIAAAIFIIFCVLISGGFIALFTIYRYKSYGTSCFDAGIFTQMYHSMINDLSLVTTCERNKFLSHFAVHCSPIYYLLLPFYYFFPSTQTLLISQAVLVAIGVIPLVLICKKNNFTNSVIVFFSMTYLFCAELIGPCFYDYHENSFLPPLLMWLFYAIESKKKILLYVFTILVMLVKEDAPIYIVCIGVYLLFSKDKQGIRKHGAIMSGLAAAYFVVVTTLMGIHGEGVMTSRTYGNFMIDYDAGFGEVIKTVIMNPAYFLSQLITEDNLVFFLTVMIPLGMMPFFTKKFSRLMLVVPFILMNLASGYAYAREIGFQYVFGTSTCLIYATIINTADLRSKKRQVISAYTAMASLYMSTAFLSGKVYFYELYSNNQEKYQKQDELLESIPEDASLACDTFYIPQAANRKEVYLLDDASAPIIPATDFVVIRLDVEYEFKESKVAQLLNDGYTYYNGDESIMAIYVSPDYEFKN